MFRIIDDVTIQFPNGELFITFFQKGCNLSIEITTRKCRIEIIPIPNLEQGQRVLNQIVPSLKRIKCFFEAIEVIGLFSKFATYKEATFMICVYKMKLSFKDIDYLTKIFHLKTKIHNGQMTINEVEYDLSYYVFWQGKFNSIGNFAGFFNKGFEFILNKEG
jgi:hypothetical protein